MRRRKVRVIEAHLVRSLQLDVLVQRVVSPLDTGSIHGRGQGVLRRDRGVEVTFLLDQSDFVSPREPGAGLRTVRSASAALRLTGRADAVQKLRSPQDPVPADLARRARLRC